MKKFIYIFILLISLLVVTISSASIENTNNTQHTPIIILELSKKEQPSEFKLPESVEIIEEEAFEGTAIIKVELPDTVKSIGERAFANIKKLHYVRIPLATKKIASTAFAGSNNVIINAAPNSYARKFAKTQGLPFSPFATFCAKNQGTVNIHLTRETPNLLYTVISEENEQRKNNRKLDETNIVRTLEIILNEIQGRGPPMGEMIC